MPARAIGIGNTTAGLKNRLGLPWKVIWEVYEPGKKPIEHMEIDPLRQPATS
jgi:hypothetical protein